MGKMNSTRCQNCKVHNPTIKKQGATKLFAVWSSRKALMENVKDGHKLSNVLERQQQQDVSLVVVGLATTDGQCCRATCALFVAVCLGLLEPPSPRPCPVADSPAAHLQLELLSHCAVHSGEVDGQGEL